MCRLPLADDETLLLVTDGVSEARDRDGCFYPYAEEVRRAVAADPRDTGPRRLVAVVRDGTLRHCGARLTDDTTVFAVRRLRELPDLPDLPDLPNVPDLPHLPDPPDPRD